MNNLIVTKFGGSSLSCACQFRKVNKIIEMNENRKFVIPSAPGKRDSKDYKITDLFYLCNTHVTNGIDFDYVFTLISERYKEIIGELNIDINIDPYLDEIREKIASGASPDYCASRGEYLNGIILADYLNFDFVDPANLIVFKKNRVFDKTATYENIQRHLSGIERAVIPGFYGAKPNGDIVTFSRGGSDITGSIIAAALDADVYENWTDVSGFLMADPRIVENPTTINKITYKELRELSYMGASVLHEEAVFPVRERGIPINIRNTNIPTDEGTLIVADNKEVFSIGEITGVAGKKDFTVIAIEKALMNTELGFVKGLLSILEKAKVSFEYMPSGVDAVSLVIRDSELDGKLDKIIKDIEYHCNPDSLEVHPNMAVIATVGRGMAKSPGIAAKVFTALANENINIRMIDQGSSEINILVGVETEDFEKAINAIYNAFSM